MTYQFALIALLCWALAGCLPLAPGHGPECPTLEPIMGDR